jgi:hypothetical protein
MIVFFEEVISGSFRGRSRSLGHCGQEFSIRRLLSFWSCYMLLHVRSSVSLHESKKVVISHTLRPTIVMLMFVALHLHIGLFKPSLKSLYDVLCFYTSTVWIHV